MKVSYLAPQRCWRLTALSNNADFLESVGTTGTGCDVGKRKETGDEIIVVFWAFRRYQEMGEGPSVRPRHPLNASMTLPNLRKAVITALAPFFPSSPFICSLSTGMT